MKTVRNENGTKRNDTNDTNYTTHNVKMTRRTTEIRKTKKKRPKHKPTTDSRKERKDEKRAGWAEVVRRRSPVRRAVHAARVSATKGVQGGDYLLFYT